MRSRLYQHRATQVLGGSMAVWAVLSIIAWHGNHTLMNACATLGAGLALWVSAVLALRTASTLIARASLAEEPSADSADRSPLRREAARPIQ